MMWVVMEAIFGSTNPRETTYRLSQRVAFFLGKNRAEAKELFSSVKKNYGWRSKVVHGSRLAKLSEKKSAEISHELQELIRKALNIILLNPDLVEKFDGGNREVYLDSLPFEEIVTLG